MNLFLIGWSTSGEAEATRAERALKALLKRLGFFDSERIERWHAPSGRVTLACVTHEPDRVGGIRYVHLDPDAMALFSGRPFRWIDDSEADGRSPLDPGFYLPPSTEWRDGLDGRCVAARYDEREGVLEVYTDPLGGYPVFYGELYGTRWISNSAELVREVLGTRELDLSVAASVLGGGWSLSGDPVWAGVRRLPGGTLHAFQAQRPDRQVELLPLERTAALLSAGFDPDQAARVLVSTVGAVADWPGRPILLQLSGGRDARLVFAAALAADIHFKAVTAGAVESADVELAGLLCAHAGIAHRRLAPDPGAVLHSRTGEAARIVRLTSGGATSLEDAAGYPFSASTGALPLWLNGQGGEISRAYYGNGNGLGRDDLIGALFRRVVGSARLLSAWGKELVKRELGSAVDEALEAGVAPEDVPDVFYLRRRMGNWAAAGHGCVEYAKGDTTAPLWTRRLLAHQLGLAPRERAAARLHRDTLEALSPHLTRVPYADGLPPPRFGPDDDFREAHDQVRHAVVAQPSHRAWEVLDRRYVGQILGRDPRSLDRHERRGMWRLGTVFMNGELERPA